MDGIGQPKLLEFNADTPTGLTRVVRLSVVLASMIRSRAMINSTRCMSGLWRYGGGLRTRSRLAAFTSRTLDDLAEGEDWVTTAYMRDTATEAGNAASELYVTEIGMTPTAGSLISDAKITALFKLYPWRTCARTIRWSPPWKPRIGSKWFEPAWKAILSNKAFLAAIWQLFPDHPLLLPARISVIPGPHPLREEAVVRARG